MAACVMCIAAIATDTRKPTTGRSGIWCALPEPWVKPYERERLADPVMQIQRDALSAKHLEHVREVREGARGATGVQGGGCGCN
jgi:hypothetical protein